MPDDAEGSYPLDEEGPYPTGLLCTTASAAAEGLK